MRVASSKHQTLAPDIGNNLGLCVSKKHGESMSLSYDIDLSTTFALNRSATVAVEPRSSFFAPWEVIRPGVVAKKQMTTTRP